MDEEGSINAAPDSGNSELEKLADRTRRSLILKLADWQDRKSWDEFYRTYWRLIYSVAIQAGLQEQEAMDVVQETILTIAKQSRKQAYDPARGSFKTWLWRITSWRIRDQFRARCKEPSQHQFPAQPGTSDTTHAIDLLPDVGDSSFEKIWEREWQDNVMQAALERVKTKVSPKQFQIFDYNVLRGMKAAEVHKKLGVTTTQVYLAKHRVGALLNKEINFIRSQEDPPRSGRKTAP